MHKFDEKASKILLNVLSHTIERFSYDPPTLDYPKSVGFFEKNAPCLINELGNSIDTVFDQFKNVLEQSIISVDSPRNLSFIPAAPTKASMIFDLVVSAGSLRGESWMESSGAVWAENQVIRWIADLVSFPESAGGCFISGGTNGNLSALVVAREEFRKSNPDNNLKLAIICSDQAHSSVKSVAKIMDCEVIVVPTNEKYQLKASLISHEMNSNVKYSNLAVFAVVATAGTTNLGVIDDIDSVASYTEKNNYWLHVDGAYGGAGLLSPKVRNLYKGIEKANSFIVDPHKWLFAPVDCAAIIYRDESMAVEAHSQKASYLDVLHENDEGCNPSDFAFHLTRRARGLPLWFSLSIYGVKEYRESVEHSLEVANYAADKIRTLPYLNLFMDPVLSIVVFERLNWSWENYNAWSKEQLRNQLCFVVPSVIDEKPVLRFAFLNPETSNSMVDEILQSLG
ncbi:MAG TPA: aspartate aminotransferase family protein [Candidatus Thioglobus sp.]|jgi:glutamate/tyrosine decarboxylase-like PLP-dependent enzyme|nr:aspartate aminotransferase family protein [Candidatus Thioglobus sp.]HIL42229.1 aspartate aminotransferase family protein [Gammaproteobacteria bacterium]